MRLQHKALTIKCLQLLRAVIYNEIVRLPDDWKDNVRSHQSLVDHCWVVTFLLYCIIVLHTPVSTHVLTSSNYWRLDC